MAGQNLFDQYFDFVRETEPPLIFHRWSLITCLGAVLARKVWFPFGQFRIFPNQYVMLIGEPGARKSTAIKMARKLISRAGYKDFAAEKTSKEKFLLDLEGLDEDIDSANVPKSGGAMEAMFGTGQYSGEPREVFIVADEFNDFMRCGDLEFHSMLGALWDWDDEDNTYKHRLKNSRSISIFQPTVSLLGGNTHTNFAEMFPPQAIGQGFLSRMLLIFSEPSGKKLPFPEPPDAKAEASLVERIVNMRLKFSGPLKLHQKAKEILHILYMQYDGFPDVRFTSYFTRRYTHLLKLCIICAVSRDSMEIIAQDVILANTILHYAEHFMPKALGEFGKAKNADVANTILKLLHKSWKPIDIPEIWKQVSNDLDRMEDLQKLLSGLQTAGKMQWVAKAKSGAGTQGYLIVRSQLSKNELYVDYTWLREYEQVKIVN